MSNTQTESVLPLIIGTSLYNRVLNTVLNFHECTFISIRSDEKGEELEYEFIKEGKIPVAVHITVSDNGTPKSVTGYTKDKKDEIVRFSWKSENYKDNAHFLEWDRMLQQFYWNLLKEFVTNLSMEPTMEASFMHGNETDICIIGSDQTIHAKFLRNGQKDASQIFSHKVKGNITLDINTRGQNVRKDVWEALHKKAVEHMESLIS